MKPLEILMAMPEWANASPDAILSSQAWAMPCRLGAKQCTMRLDAIHPAETLDLSVRFENEEHVLGIADSPAFPELNAVWASRTAVPEPILLALVEKDCGELLQLLENAVHRQLKIEGLAKDAASPDAKTVFAQVIPQDDAAPVVFSLDLSPSISAALGLMRNIDAASPAIRETKLPAETEYASFALSAADTASLEHGDALLLPEVETTPPRIIAAKKFVLSDAASSEWKDEGLVRVCAAEGTSIALGTLFDSESGGAAALPPPPRENTPLKLVRFSKKIATGRFGDVAGQRAFIVD